MCRHLAYLGHPVTLAEVLTEPSHSLYQQSWAPRMQRHGTVNADGFGVGWYPPQGEPARYRRSVPIWTDPNLPELARTIRSGAILAAVRSATAGTSQDESAAAPYRDGRWLFSHNGALRDWRRLPEDVDLGLGAADLLALESSCDSALLWAAISARLRRGEEARDALTAAIRQIAQVRPDARLNLLLTDGRTIIATRYGDSLWYRQAPGRLLVASEPGDDSGAWREVPEHTLIHGDPGGIHFAALEPAPVSDKGSAAASPDAAAEQIRPAERGSRHSPRFTLERRLPADYFAVSLRADVLRGLAAPPRWLPPKWFYDAAGSELFEQITLLPEYYPTRAEQEILTDRAAQIAADTRARTLVELGAGSSRKTRLLLDALTDIGTLEQYAPLDVSASALTEAGDALCRDYPALRVAATVTDFETEFALPHDAGPRLIAFLGGTIGNLDAEQRRRFFAGLRAALADGDAFLLGADLVKDRDVLVRAYDDSQGVTAAFNKNVLYVLNRELGADFDPDAFDHRAVWNADDEQIEMWLRSRTAQTVKIRALDLTVEFDRDEEMRTEISVKFRREALIAELARAGFALREWWTDAAGRFALLLAVPTNAGS
jgi:dimethylhistidine N-methyltransferase/ergothioneine biosynthesis protein EgtC